MFYQDHDILNHYQAQTQNSVELQQLPGKLVELKGSLRTILAEWERYYDTLTAGTMLTVY